MELILISENTQQREMDQKISKHGNMNLNYTKRKILCTVPTNIRNTEEEKSKYKITQRWEFFPQMLQIWIERKCLDPLENCLKLSRFTSGWSFIQFSVVFLFLLSLSCWLMSEERQTKREKLCNLWINQQPDILPRKRKYVFKCMNLTQTWFLKNDSD